MHASLQTSWDTARIGLQLWLSRVTASATRAAVAAGVVLVGLTLVVGSADASTGFVSPRTTVSYYGLTSADGPIVIQTSRDGRVIKRAIGAIDMQCSGGAEGPYSFTIKDRWSDIIVSVGRSFKESYSDSDSEGDASVDVSGEFTGRFDKRRNTVSGTWRASFVTHAADGTTITCDSGVLKFSAQRMRA